MIYSIVFFSSYQYHDDIGKEKLKQRQASDDENAEEVNQEDDEEEEEEV